MDDDQEVEEFGITDYDLMQGMGMGLGYRKRRFTKEQAIYGMWAEKDSDDEGGYGGRKTKDYSKPLNFVSGGVVQKGKKDKKDEAKKESEGIVFRKYEWTRVLCCMLRACLCPLYFGMCFFMSS